MRFFQKRNDNADVEVRLKHHGERQYYDSRFGRKHASRSEDAAAYPNENWHREQRRNGQSLGNRPVSGDFDDYRNKQSLGELVRKLNCAAPRKEEIDVQLYPVRAETIGSPLKRTPTWVPSRKGRSQSDITRPVLITVKDGDLEDPAPFDEHKMAELKSSFIIGEMPTAIRTGSPFKIGVSARQIHSERAKKSNGRDIINKNSSTFSGWRYGARNGSMHVSGPDSDAIRTAQDIARKERWRRGLEMEQRMWRDGYGEGNNHIEGDDSIMSDYRTQGSHTTGNTGEYSSVGPDTLTTVTDTDDSYDSDDVRYGRSHRQPAGGHFGIKGAPSCRQYAVQGVAEDLGIVARLLMADGGACLGTAAAITRETVANCRDGKL
jgi:hypothetical protein